MESMKYLRRMALRIAVSADGNPVLASATVFLFWLAFNVVEAAVEKLIFGERFEHWLDPLFGLAFMAYAGWCVWICAEVQVSKINKESKQ